MWALGMNEDMVRTVYFSQVKLGLQRGLHVYVLGYLFSEVVVIQMKEPAWGDYVHLTKP